LLVDSQSAQIEACTAVPQSDWRWLTSYLRLDDDLAAILATFPNDAPMRAAMAHCHGLRLLRQEPWECLASFILSSTKQVAQIQQCVRLICDRFGDEVLAPADCGKQFTFPSAARLAGASEAELRECKMGFRAKYLRGAAALVASGDLDLETIQKLPIEEAREQLMRCPGVGRKIADCALLFSCGFEEAFPIDVWIERAVRVLFMRNRKVSRERMELFAAKHFGPHRGYAQQYLFHHLRTTKWRE
jgi:N-glycosylase/DNA lyase